MAHKADGRKDRFRRHCFASINAPAENQAPPPVEDATFQRGLSAPLADDPALPQTKKMPGQENPDASPENRSALEPEKTDAGNPQDPAASVCIWEQFGDTLKKLDEEKSQTFARAAAETLKLSLAISQKILNAPPGIDPEKTRDLVDKTWQRIEQEHVVHLKVSPDDMKALKETVLDAAGLNVAGAGYVFDEDARLENSTCTVAGPCMGMQKSLHKQLPLIEREFPACCLKKQPYGHTASASQSADRSKAHIPYKGRP